MYIERSLNLINVFADCPSFGFSNRNLFGGLAGEDCGCDSETSSNL